MTKKRANILIVEDNPADIDLMRYTFKKSKLENELVIIEDGESALKYILKKDEYSDSPTPDMIILDINIPKINGLEVLRMIKQDEEARLIPVVIMTTSSSEEDILKAYKNYVNAYLVKPIDIHNFIDVILKLEDFMIQVVKKPNLT